MTANEARALQALKALGGWRECGRTLANHAIMSIDELAEALAGLRRQCLVVYKWHGKVWTATEQEEWSGAIGQELAI